MLANGHGKKSVQYYSPAWFLPMLEPSAVKPVILLT